MKISNKLNFMFLLAKADTLASRKLHGQGLGFGDLAVLYAISQAPEGKIRRIDLAEAVGLTASGVTRLLIPLEKIGVIKREAHELDGRVSYTALTKAGKNLLEDSIKWAELKCDDLLANAEAKKIEQAADILKNIVK